MGQITTEFHAERVKLTQTIKVKAIMKRNIFSLMKILKDHNEEVLFLIAVKVTEYKTYNFNRIDCTAQWH